MSLQTVGRWAFLIGLIIAVLAAFIPGYVTIIALVLFVLGLIVGFLNITDKDVVKFLVAVIALLTLGIGSISALSILDIVATYINLMLGNFIAFVGAAGLIISIKAILEASKK